MVTTPPSAAPRVTLQLVTRASRTVIRYGFVPLLLVGLNGAAARVLDLEASRAWLLVLILVALAASFVAERLLPYEASWNDGRGDTGRDVVHGLVNELLSVASVAAFPLLAGRFVVVDLWPREWPLVVQLVVAVLALDLGITLGHLASHHLSWLWRLHAVHHSVKRFYGLNGWVKHPLHQVFEMTLGVAPLVLIGLPEPVAAGLAFAAAVQLLLQHSNVDYRVGTLRSLLALNEGHRFHHLPRPGDGDVNFGLFTLVWDHLLGTFAFDPARRFTSAELGIEARPDFPVDWLAQVLDPFRAQARAEGDLLAAWVEEELALAAQRRARGELAGAWAALERAHVLSQPRPWLHVVSHWHMLVLGAETFDLREVVGQLVRLVVAAPGSALGRAPTGNTGRARVGLFSAMAIEPALADRLQRAGVPPQR